MIPTGTPSSAIITQSPLRRFFSNPIDPIVNWCSGGAQNSEMTWPSAAVR
jgi:hypothetical protein